MKTKKTVKPKYTREDLNKLQTQLTALSTKFSEVREYVQDFELRPFCKSLIGKCFVYRNTCDGHKYWKMWVRVVAAKGHYLTLAHAQKDNSERIRFEHCPYPLFETRMSADYVPCSLEEYTQAVNKLLEEAAHMDKV